MGIHGVKLPESASSFSVLGLRANDQSAPLFGDDVPSQNQAFLSCLRLPPISSVTCRLYHVKS